MCGAGSVTQHTVLAAMHCRAEWAPQGSAAA